MLRITIEQLPGGDPQRKKTLRVLEITNVSGLEDPASYHAVALGETSRDKREGVVGPHMRTTWGPWKLVAKAIAALKLDHEGR